MRPARTRPVGTKLYFALRRSSAEAAKTAGARVRTASSESPRSKALAWEGNDKSEVAFMIGSSIGSWAGLPATGRSRGAQRSRINRPPPGRRGRPPSSLTASTPRYNGKSKAIPPLPSSALPRLSFFNCRGCRSFYPSGGNYSDVDREGRRPALPTAPLQKSQLRETDHFAASDNQVVQHADAHRRQGLF